ncbi:hypothetical protein KEM55_004193 [Ascosphaera atra]|nr:hypothetical protein KEM55_004193 [Ascosphaera atra]
MPNVTEFVYLKIKEDADLGNPSTAEANIFADFIAATKGVSGYKAFAWGVTEEKDAGYNTVCAIQWEGPQTDAPLATIKEIVDLSLPPITFKTVLEPLSFNEAVFPKNDAISPFICELVALGYPEETSKTDLSKKVHALFQNLGKITDVTPPNSYTTGFLLDTFVYPDGRRATISYSVAQWNSVQDHMDARDTDTFAKYIAPLRENMIFSPWQMRHVRFVKIA